MTVATKQGAAPQGAGPRLGPTEEPRTSALSTVWGERTIFLIAASAVLHWAIAASTALSDTEAYYAGWARHPALSYYDHPPLIAWTTWLLARSGRAFGDAAIVRLGPVLYAAIFYALVYRLAARLFSPRAAFYAVSIVAVIPVFFLSGFLVNPEAPLAPLWTLFLLLLMDLEDHDEPWRPLALGAVVGVAFLAKYTAVLALPVTLAYVVSSPAARWLRRPSFYGAGLVALLIASPVIAWNARWGWPSLHLHLSERLGTGQSEPVLHALARVGEGQLAYFQPVFLPALLAVLGYALVRSARDRRYRLLAAASLPVLGFLLAVMVRASDSEPHWPMMGYMPLAVAAGGLLDEAEGRLGAIAHGVYRLGLGLSGAVVALYAVHLSTPALANRLPRYDPASDPINETVGWDRVRLVAEAHAAALGPATVVAGAHNVLCGHLQAALDDRPAVYCASRRRTEFDFIGRRSPPADVPVVFVDSERYPEDPASSLPRHTCGPPEPIPIDRGGRHAATYRVYDCAPRGAGAP
jgi:4-amino-4-deoxy-L-arabinose transferase-like glycosyltransferase